MDVYFFEPVLVFITRISLAIAIDSCTARTMNQEMLQNDYM
jgi:hypothetical protein